MTFKLTIDGVDYTQHLALPVKWNALLDERLDEGRASLRHTKKDLFRIGAQVTLNLGNGDGDIGFIVAEDEAAEIPCGSGYYNHELMLIEPTKLLEGVVVESLTFTNALGRTFEVNPVEAIRENLSDSSGIYPHKTDYMTPMQQGAILHVSSYTDTFDENDLPFIPVGQENAADPTITVINPLNQEIEKRTITTREELTTLSFDVILSMPGLYQVIYQFESPAADPQKCKFGFTITSILSYDALPKWTIASVIDRVLDLAEPHRVSVQPRYKLDPAQREAFAAIESPEFAFTGLTLKGILDQIGGFIHGVPRLITGESGQLDTIHYDMLGGTEEALLADPKYDGEYVTLIKTHNIENYATELDSTVENLVNTLDAGEGAITEPYFNGFKTVRSEDQYARITDGNMVIETSLPVYSVQKLEVITPDGKVGDITGYVFEGAEYGRLSSFEGNYPTSKAFAIYYTLGEKNIKGLNYKSSTVIGGSDAKYSIANIIQAVTGWDIKGSWWTKTNYPKLAFRITYTPIFSARVLQHKPFIEAGALKRSLIYNQGANLVETRYYGENMKGAIARMGNPETVMTYRLSGKPTGLKLIPKIGQMWRGSHYVSAVTCEAYSDHVVCTIGLSKDFNRLSQYIGINSEWRAYEVSERKAYNRDMVYRDFCVIGDAITSDRLQLVTSGVNYIANTFLQSADKWVYLTNVLTVAEVTTYDDLNNAYSVTLPVASTAMGNTLLFSFGMADNYSAGAKSVYDGNGEITGYWQTDVPYSDYYGRASTLAFDLTPAGDSVSYGDETGFLLPQGTYGTGDAPISTIANRIRLDKNGSEILRMNYQICFVSNWSDLIIGPAMTHNDPMVSGLKQGHSAKLYILPTKVGRFDTRINTAGATSVIDIPDDNVNTTTTAVYFAETVATADGAAWAIADMATGEILLARNVEVKSGEAIQMPQLTVTHELP